jgi:hypothetical protein
MNHNGTGNGSPQAAGSTESSQPLVTWFRNQFQSSGEALVWAFEQIGAGNRHRVPPAADYLGKWAPARHVWHVTEYERYVGLAMMRTWLEEPIREGWDTSEEAWAYAKKQSPEQFVEAFQQVQQRQLAALDDLAQLAWSSARHTFWGVQPLSMVVTKTLQHRFEHTDTLLRMGLWWEEIEHELSRQRANQRQNGQ